jgi:ABC-type uncharacterized transport system permease subunit
MSTSLIVAILGSIGFAIAAIAVYANLRFRAHWSLPAIRIAAPAAIIINLIFIIVEVQRLGVFDALRQNFDSTLLLATLIGLVGLGTHMAPTLRGLDGFLFIVATLAQAVSISTMNRPGMSVTDRPWFVSHSVAFALSGTFFVAGGLAGIAYLLVHRMLRQKKATTLVGRLASLEALERFARWMPVIGFPLFTYGILTGLCGIAHRRDILERASWYLDMSFIMSIVAWGIYAYLCFGVLYRPRLRGRRMATLSTYGLGLIVVVFLCREFLSPVHQ